MGACRSETLVHQLSDNGYTALMTISAFATATRILARPRYFTLAAVLSLAFFLLYLYIPAWLVPGNTIKLELGLLTLRTGILLAALALVTGVLWTLQTYLFINRGAIKGAATCSIGFLSSIAGGVAAASCGCGYAIILGVFGLAGAAPFMLAHETLVVLVLLIFVATGLLLTVRNLVPTHST